MPKPSQIQLQRSVPNAPSVADSNSNASNEVVPSPGKRRTFTAAEKLRIVREAAACTERGGIEALLRREGIYSSLLTSWRRQLSLHGSGGLVPRSPGRKPKLDAKDRQLLAMTKENAVLRRKLQIADGLIALQKKAHEILGIALPEFDEESL